jgi:hypothetical protein
LLRFEQHVSGVEAAAAQFVAQALAFRARGRNSVPMIPLGVDVVFGLLMFASFHSALPGPFSPAAFTDRAF